MGTDIFHFAYLMVLTSGTKDLKRANCLRCECHVTDGCHMSCECHVTDGCHMICECHVTAVVRLVVVLSKPADIAMTFLPIPSKY